MTSISVTIDEHTRQDAVKVLSGLGLTMTDAIRLYLEEISRQGALPFPIDIPNKKTIAAMREADRGEGEPMTNEELKALWNGE